MRDLKTRCTAKAYTVKNRNQFLFPVAFRKDLDWYYDTHRAARRLGVQKCGDYVNMMAGLNRQFGSLLERRLETNDQKEPELTLAPLDFATREKMNPEELLKAHKEVWKSKGEKITRAPFLPHACFHAERQRNLMALPIVGLHINS